MKVRVAAVGPRDLLVPVIAAAADLPGISVVSCGYVDPAETHELILSVRDGVHAYLFNGPAPARLASALIPRDSPSVTVRYDPSAVAKTLFRIYRELPRAMEVGVSIDCLGQQETNELEAELGLSPGLLRRYDLRNSWEKNAIVDHHRKLLRQRQVAAAAVGLRAAYQQLKGEGLPVYNVRPTKLAIRNALAELFVRACHYPQGVEHIAVMIVTLAGEIGENGEAGGADGAGEFGRTSRTAEIVGIDEINAKDQTNRSGRLDQSGQSAGQSADTNQTSPGSQASQTTPTGKPGISSQSSQSGQPHIPIPPRESAVAWRVVQEYMTSILGDRDLTVHHLAGRAMAVIGEAAQMKAVAGLEAGANLSSRIHRATTVAARIGFGVAETVPEARFRAQLALRAGNQAGISIVDSYHDAKVADEHPKHLPAPPAPSARLLPATRRGGQPSLVPKRALLQAQKVRDRLGTYCVTAADVASALRLSARSGRRLLLAWSDAGLAELVGSKINASSGRPRQVYELFL